MQESKQGIKSIELGIEILKKVSEYDRPLSITEISNICDMSKSKLYRYLISFVKTGYLEKDENLKYTIGNELILLGVRALDNVNIGKIATPYIHNLRDNINETVALGLWGENGPFFVKWEPSFNHANISLGVREGSQINVTKSATGKIFTAFLPREKTKKLVSNELNGDDMAIEAFYEEVKVLRETKFATTQDTLLPAISALSVPIFGRNGIIMAALNVVGFTDTLDMSDDSNIAKEMKKNAYLLSTDLGYTAIKQ
ncbi:IclR family transcriptional regulator [Oceanobacillus rekensis]|uniref:IclR family transcriptional regulator n=1 Tax=Oceanobacillus rekensis TaxID=937927 RepID=UPI000B454C56|nr:IclR family transcriptional regulator [Oceanobacillus rekensis]